MPCTRRTFLGLAGLSTLPGCWTATGNEAVVYSALDEEFSQPILDRFHDQTGITVRAKFDTESTKSVSLAEALIAERHRPRCDVFWNNEILHTLRLEKLGLLESYKPPRASEFPTRYQSPTGAWHGFAARARVLIVNTQLLPEANRPSSIRDLIEPKWHGKVGIAKPLFGTTATHAACLFASWGETEARAFFTSAKPIVQIMAGNRHVAEAVAAGQLAWGITDTDDALVEQQKGLPVTIVYPDQQPDGLGTLLIPNTLAVLKGAPHSDQARRLVDWLLTPEVENLLAASASAQIPLHPQGRPSPRLIELAKLRTMSADFAAAADMWDRAARFLREEFTAAS